MNERIKPALSAKHWAEALAPNATIKPNGRYEIERETSIVETIHPSPIQRIALLNHILPDDDSRKITRKTIDLLRSATEDLGGRSNAGNEFERLADALESYLPPVDLLCVCGHALGDHFAGALPYGVACSDDCTCKSFRAGEG